MSSLFPAHRPGDLFSRGRCQNSPSRVDDPDVWHGSRSEIEGYYSALGAVRSCQLRTQALPHRGVVREFLCEWGPFLPASHRLTPEGALALL